MGSFPQIYTMVIFYQLFFKSLFEYSLMMFLIGIWEVYVENGHGQA